MYHGGKTSHVDRNILDTVHRVEFVMGQLMFAFGEPFAWKEAFEPIESIDPQLLFFEGIF